jgi:hypothetical protein
MTTDNESNTARRRLSWWAGASLLSAIAVFFLWQEHRAHMLGALPWLLVLACPLMHVFMHRGHGHSTSEGGYGGQRPHQTDAHHHGGTAP